MVRILGNTLANKQKIFIALTKIYGIGKSLSLKILKSLNIDIYTNVSNLTENEISQIREYLENSNLKLEGNLKRIINTNIKHLINIKCNRGKRLLKGLPTRGQRTHTNNRTARRCAINITLLK